MLFVLIEILSYESRISIGDKIRKEGVFRKKMFCYIFLFGIVYLLEGVKCVFLYFCVVIELLDEIMII